VVGWRHIGPHPALAEWAGAARDLAVRALAASGEPVRCGGTWAVGLDLLDNAEDGSVSGVALPWQVLGLGPEPLHKAQLSAIYPGYPQPSDAESAAAYGFRLRRDAAHLDGLLPIGPARARMVKEPHGWILGLPLTDCSPDAAPLVVWEGSHLVMREALLTALSGRAPDTWGEVDLTAAYTAARAQVFETCRRVELPARPGEATLLHRHILHGVAPWRPGAKAPPEGRIIAYFRPLMASVQDWLTAA
jgi:hypothetical protein